MKHKLLVLGVFLMASVSLSAQSYTANRTKPTISTFVDMIDDGSTTQYLYNVGAQKFFCGKNNWNTRASIDEYADPVRMTYIPDEFDELNYWDFGVYPSKYRTDINAWRSLSGKNWDDMWTDGVEGNDTYLGVKMWIVTKVGDVYKFSNDYFNQEYEFGPTDATLGWAEYVNGSFEDTRLYLYYQHTVTVTKHFEDGDESVDEDCFQGNFYDEWKFVSEDDYTAYADGLDKYYAGESLKAALEKAYTENAGINLDAPLAVYNNMEATPEELKEAEASIAGIVIEFLTQTEVDPNNPKDFSSSIVNPTFDTVGDFTGWSSGFGAGGDQDTCAEIWRGTFDVHQDIAGLPEGVYMLACNGYSRYKDNHETDYNYWKAGNKSRTSLYITSESAGTFSTAVKLISEGGSLDAGLGNATNNVTATFVDEEGYEYEAQLFTPSTMVQANAYFHDEDNPTRYHNEVYGALGAGETLRIGVKSDTNEDWNIFDDFQIYYFGASADAYKVWGSKVAENSNVSFPEEVYYGAPDKEAYEAALNDLKGASTKEEVIEKIKALSEATDAVEQGKKNYLAFVDAYNEAYDWLIEAEENHIQGDPVDKLADYLQVSAEDETDWGFPHGHVNSFLNLEEGEYVGKLSGAEIAEETLYIQELKEKAVKEGMVEGSDVTGLLKNPNFDGTFDGWTYKEGKLGNHNVECYYQVVDVYQIVNNVKPGIYAITCNAFERPGENGSYSGDEPSKVFLFMNQFQTPVQNICKDAIADEDCIEQENCYRGTAMDGAWPYDYNTSYGWVPNSVDGAYYAFNAGRYVQTCYGLVGDDGVMKVGLTSNGEQCAWVLWANFKLTYMGENEEAIEAVTQDFLATAAEMDLTECGKPEADALTQAIGAAEAAEGGDAKMEALTNLVDAISDVKTSIKLMSEANQLLIDLDNAIWEYADVASEEAQTNANQVNADHSAGISGYTYSIEEVESAIEAIKGAISALKMPDISEASDDTPVDMTSVIVNPSYDDGSEGWSSARQGGGQSRDDMNERYYASFDHNQVLTGMPAGTYELTLNCFNRIPGNNAQQDLDAFEAGRKSELSTAFVYAKVGDQTYAEPFRMVSEGAREEWNLDGNHTTSTSSLTGKVLYCPDSMVAAGACFEEMGWDDELGDEVPLSDELNYVVRVVFTLTEQGDITIGCMNTSDQTWCCWDNWTLTYFGTESEKQDSGDATSVESIENNASVVATEIYNVGGARIAKMQRGLNIVKMSDGSFRKVYVK